MTLLCEVSGRGKLTVRNPEELLRKGAQKGQATTAIRAKRSRQIVPSSVILTGGGRVKLTIRLTAAAQKLLLEGAELKIKVQISFEASDGATAGRKATITLKRNPKSGRAARVTLKSRPTQP